MSNRRLTSQNDRFIPPPPGPEEGYDAIIAYFQKYSTTELEKAGHLMEASAQEIQELTASAAYQYLCENGLHLKLPRKLFKQLSLLAAREDIRVEDLVKRWIQQGLRKEADQSMSRTN